MAVELESTYESQIIVIVRFRPLDDALGAEIDMELEVGREIDWQRFRSELLACLADCWDSFRAPDYVTRAAFAKVGSQVGVNVQS